MAERKVSGLKEYAQEHLLREVRVTPALRERLAGRIHRGEGPSKRRMPWISAAVVGVAFLAIVVGPLLPKREPAPSAEPPPYRERSRPAPELPSREPAITLASSGFAQVTVADSIANTVTLNAAVQDQAGSPVALPESALPGVEAQPGQRIVLNADYTLQVGDAHAAVEALQGMALRSGGYVVEATLQQGSDGAWLGHLLLRIPAAQFSGAVDQMSSFGQVKAQRLWSQDVTERYADLESRLKVLQEHEEKLQALALQAANFDDWLRLAKQLNETRSQVESLQGSLKRLENQVAYSTLTIDLTQPAPGSVQSLKGEGLGAQMGAAFTGSVALLGEAGRAFLIGVAGSAPLVLPLGGGLLWFLVGWRRRQRQSGDS